MNITCMTIKSHYQLQHVQADITSQIDYRWALTKCHLTKRWIQCPSHKYLYHTFTTHRLNKGSSPNKVLKSSRITEHNKQIQRQWHLYGHSLLNFYHKPVKYVVEIVIASDVCYHKVLLQLRLTNRCVSLHRFIWLLFETFHHVYCKQRPA